MSLELIAMFCDDAARHMKAAKEHYVLDVRLYEQELAEDCFANALCCRDLSIMTRNRIIAIRQEWREDIRSRGGV